MRVKNLVYVFALTLALGVCASIASAQVVPATGRVTLRQADGTEAPLQGATVKFYRTDIRGQYEVRTGRDGRYVYAGMPFNGTFTIVVSGPGARPTFVTGIRIAQQGENNFTLEPGDGSAPTLEQVQAANAAQNTQGASGQPQMSAREIEEENARRTAANAANEEAQRTAAAMTTQLNDILRNANAAYQARNYDQAITLYDQGIQAAADEPVFHLNRSLALQNRGAQRYNAANTVPSAQRTAARAPALADLVAAVEASERAVTLRRARSAGSQPSPGGTPPQTPAGSGQNEMLSYLSTRADNYRTALQVGAQVSAEAAATAIQEYVTAETDPTKRSQAEVGLGYAMLQGGNTEQAITTLRGIVTANPNNLDALYYLGIALSTDESKTAEARTVFQQFVSRAPATDQRRAEVEAIIESLQPAPSTNTQRRRRP